MNTDYITDRRMLDQNIEALSTIRSSGAISCAWLDDSAVPASLVKMLKPAGERVLACHPVSKRVNSSRADGDDATLIDKIDF
jgi:hypothetical protein